MINCELPAADTIDGSMKESFALPPEELVRQALAKLSNKGTQLIIWGGMLDRYLGIPRVYKVCAQPHFHLFVAFLSTPAGFLFLSSR